jgi:F-type H+-transporting ATPase subunit b
MKKTGLFRHRALVMTLGVMGVLIFGQGVAFAAGIQVIPDKSVVIQLINFIFLIIILNILLYKPIRKIIAQRKEKFSDLQNHIDQSTQDAQEKNDAFNAGVRDARSKGAAEKEARIQAGAEEEKRVIDEISQKNQADLQEIRVKIAADTEKVRESLQAEVDAFAADIGQKILGRAF